MAAAPKMGIPASQIRHIATCCYVAVSGVIPRNNYLQRNKWGREKY